MKKYLILFIAINKIFSASESMISSQPLKNDQHKVRRLFVKCKERCSSCGGFIAETRNSDKIIIEELGVATKCELHTCIFGFSTGILMRAAIATYCGICTF